MIKYIYSKCFNCRKKHFFVRKRKVPMPFNPSLVATSREKLCKNCYQAILQAVKQPKHE